MIEIYFLKLLGFFRNRRINAIVESINGAIMLIIVLIYYMLRDHVVDITDVYD